MSEQKINFLDTVINYCENGDTGTLFISTKNNKASQIVIKNGEIIAATMGRIKGFKAIVEVEKVGIKGASFTEKTQMPFSAEAYIECSDTVLKKCGYMPLKNDTLQELLRSNETATSSQKTKKSMLDTEAQEKREFDSKSDDEILQVILNRGKS